MYQHDYDIHLFSSFFNDPTSMLEMTSRALLPSTDNVNTPIQEILEALLWVLVISTPIPFYESFQLCEKFLDWVEVGRVRGQVHELDSCIRT